MKLEKAKVEIFEQKSLQDLFADNDYVENLIRNGNMEMLEHVTIYLTVDRRKHKFDVERLGLYYRSENCRVEYSDAHGNCITTNLKFLIENNWTDDLQFQTEPKEDHHKRVTVEFICDQSTSHEFAKNETFSFTEVLPELHTDELTFIIPKWMSLPEMTLNNNTSNFEVLMTANEANEGDKAWILSLLHSEKYYLQLIKYGWRALGVASTILPNALKTQIMVSGFVDDWFGAVNVREKQVHDNGVNSWVTIISEPWSKEKEHTMEVEHENNPRLILELSGFFPVKLKSENLQMRELATRLYEMFQEKNITQRLDW